MCGHENGVFVPRAILSYSSDISALTRLSCPHLRELLLAVRLEALSLRHPAVAHHPHLVRHFAHKELVVRHEDDAAVADFQEATRIDPDDKPER